MTVIKSKKVSSREQLIPSKKNPRGREKNEPKLKLSFSEQHEFKTIETDIAKDEKLLMDISKRIQAEASDYIKLSDLANKRSEIEKDLSIKMDRWLYLTDLVEKIDDSKRTKEDNLEK